MNRHLAAVALILAGTAILAALVAFVSIAMNFGASFAGTYRSTEDIAMGLAALSPIVVVALLLIGYGRYLLRKE